MTNQNFFFHNCAGLPSWHGQLARAANTGSLKVLSMDITSHNLVCQLSFELYS